MSAGKLMCTTGVNSSGSGYEHHLLDIEKAFDHCRHFTWLSANWTLIYYFIAGYLLTILAGRKYMERRPAFQLRGALFLWNVSMAGFSAVAAERLLSAGVYAVRTQGFHASMCYSGYTEQKQATALWLLLFIFSKIVEFGDTAFIVLRKTPLNFLHWYHHVTVAFFVWSSGAYASPMQAYFSGINLLVHAVMYPYYALKAIRVRVPKAVSMVVTSLQLLQMVLGILITGYMYKAKVADQSCLVTGQGIVIAASIYCSYLVLFSNFFVKTYLVRRKPLDDVRKSN